MTEKKQTKAMVLIEKVKEIIASYTIKLTLRQIYYRLVTILYFENKTSNYKMLSRVLVKARKNGLIPYEAIEDRTRDVKSDIFSFKNFWRVKVLEKIDGIGDYPNATYSTNTFQLNVPVIILEKQALEGIFMNALKDRNHILITCKGYNSLTQMNDFRVLYNQYPNKKFHCYFFSDFDPSGYDIQTNFINQCVDLGIKFASFRRISLKQYQVKKFGFPLAMTKTTDSRSANWNHSGVVELDAVDPKMLHNWVQECQAKQWDNIIYLKVRRVAQIQNRRSKKLYIKLLKIKMKELEDML